jgi:hypothetical protein
MFWGFFPIDAEGFSRFHDRSSIFIESFALPESMKMDRGIG